MSKVKMSKDPKEKYGDLDLPKAGDVVLPENNLLKAFSIARVEHGWVFITITLTQFGDIVGVEHSDPDLKVIILEKYKIASQRYFNSIG